MREHEHNMSPLIIKNKTLFTREKLEYHLKDDVLWRLLGGHEFLFNKLVPTSGGSRGARVPPLFLDQTEARKAEKITLRPHPLSQRSRWPHPPPPPQSAGLNPSLLTRCWMISKLPAYTFVRPGIITTSVLHPQDFYKLIYWNHFRPIQFCRVSVIFEPTHQSLWFFLSSSSPFIFTS